MMKKYRDNVQPSGRTEMKEETEYFTPNMNRRARTGIWPDTTSRNPDVNFSKMAHKSVRVSKENKSN